MGAEELEQLRTEREDDRVIAGEVGLTGGVWARRKATSALTSGWIRG